MNKRIAVALAGAVFLMFLFRGDLRADRNSGCACAAGSNAPSRVAGVPLFRAGGRAGTVAGN